MRRRSFLFGALGAAVHGCGAQATAGRIAYVQEDGLWLRELPDGKPRRLVDGAKMDSPRVSPSGQWIACFRHDVLHVVSLDGGRVAQLGQPDRGSAAPGYQWCVGRDQLLVDAGNGLNLFTADDGWRRAARKIPGAGLPVVFSPRGSDIVYGDDVTVGRGPGGEPMRNGRLCRISLDGQGGAPAVLQSEYLAAKIPCLWSRTGDFVVFWQDPDFSASAIADGLELFRIPANGGKAQSLGVSTFVRADAFSLGGKLAVSTGGGRDAWEEKRIAVIDLETAAVSYLTDTNIAAVCPAWSPDGTSLAYSAAPGPGAVNSVGGGEEARRLLSRRSIWRGGVKLTGDSRYRDEEPMWSADGQQILFCRMSRDNRKTLWLMGADGSNAMQVAGPLYMDPGVLGVDDSWFGYYGSIAWRDMFDWFRG